ncbi:MAG: hypothetical protein A2X13_04875 [Bacteroidetes bacterium GWC2_33_15]|nr:MAG: hypothetical protein A2X10_12745 [Bacteroidetes bacterium GWA2_33_15]OFX50927.1 MAG: hypothetical protein A2X13_04875 [Bacteroidetes bacterium GWC2_33_15]OFX66568.1 MAG: hypothetical protein A2X15_15485 [Bacteroidetes bacterium GWB2_32_14]OFX70153.1 MAG: hypothetical protein A2X14_12635 [Bacteroidetes bacterium GWD2_33_33]HAN20036.1 hypothetical protein [Bacteroidales bacterium]
MKYTFFLLINIFFINLIFGQSDTKLHSDKKENNTLNIESIIQKQLKTSQVNVFLNEDWQGGLMMLNNNQLLTGYLYRYNIFTDQIELKSVVNPTNIEIISIGNKKFIYSDYYSTDFSLNSGYFEIIENGKCKLLLKRSIKQNEEENRASKYFGSSTSASTSVVEAYYIKKDKEPAVLIEKNKESLLRNLSDKKEFQNYLEKKMILIINENKLIELINRYNKL